MRPFPKHYSVAFAGLLATAGLVCGHVQAADAKRADPWRLSRVVGLPAWLELTGTHRIRYETLDGQFRVGREGGDQMLALRTMLRLEAKTERWSVVGEMIDARQELADTGTPAAVLITSVNTVELLQGYVALRLDGLWSDASRSEIRVGRQTLDVGSRRLASRNNFRNTINAFTGVHWRWQAEDGPQIQAFYVLPVVPRPLDPASLLDNEIEFDEESFDLQFWGLHVQWPELLRGATGEVYGFGLHENDSADLPTRNRTLYTPGLRLFRQPGRGAWDFEAELALQFGTTRSTVASVDTRDLDHFAHFHHLEAGYTFDEAWSPRLAVLYDYASGDDNPTDGDSNRFDTLFGARRFEHGPTGLYGAFARSNIHAPGLQLSARPRPALELMTAYRPYWLASDTDAWTTSGLRDPSGDSGSFIGHQLEGRMRWEAVPGNLRLEFGGAYLFAGEFIENAPNATDQGATAYGYMSLEFIF